MGLGCGKDVLYRGDGFETLFGYNKKDFSGKMQGWNNLVHPDDLDVLSLTIKNYWPKAKISGLMNTTLQESKWRICLCN